MNGLFGKVPAGPWMAASQQQQMPREKERKPFFDTTAGKLAAAGQILLSRGRYNPALEYRAQQDAMAERQRMAEQQRANDWTDWQRKRQYLRDNPEPQKLPNIALESQWFNSLPPEEQARVSQALDVLRPVMTTTWQGPQVLPRSAQSAGQGQVLGAQLPQGWTIQGQ